MCKELYLFDPNIVWRNFVPESILNKEQLFCGCFLKSQQWERSKICASWEAVAGKTQPWFVLSAGIWLWLTASVYVMLSSIAFKQTV